MATSDVPGHVPAHRDTLAPGVWAEHDDGSIILVKEIDEDKKVHFEVYDIKDPSNPVYFVATMPDVEFKENFSYRRGRHRLKNIKWTWHDKTPMPIEKVMSIIKKTSPIATKMDQTISAAEKVSRELAVQIKKVLTEQHLLGEMGLEERPMGKKIHQRLLDAMKALVP